MYMFKYILKRLGLMLMTFSIIFVMCFVLIKLLPVDFTTAGFGQDKELLEIRIRERGLPFRGGPLSLCMVTIKIHINQKEKKLWQQM